MSYFLAEMQYFTYWTFFLHFLLVLDVSAIIYSLVMSIIILTKKIQLAKQVPIHLGMAGTLSIIAYIIFHQLEYFSLGLTYLGVLEVGAWVFGYKYFYEKHRPVMYVIVTLSAIKAGLLMVYINA